MFSPSFRCLICLLAHKANPNSASSFCLRVNVMSSSCTLFTLLIWRCQLVRQKKTATMSKLNGKGFFFLFFFFLEGDVRGKQAAKGRI